MNSAASSEAERNDCTDMICAFRGFRLTTTGQSDGAETFEHAGCA